MEWLKEWVVPLSASVTFLLAIAAFWAIWQSYTFRKEDKELSIKIRNLDKFISWANIMRKAYLDSMDEYTQYIREEEYHLKALNANLKTQSKNLKAQKAAVNEQELRDLRQELRQLQKEEVELQSRDLSKDNYLSPRLFSILSPVVAEYEILKPEAKGFGKDFKDSFDKTGEVLRRIVKSLETPKESADQLFEELFKYENVRLINLFYSEADALRSLLIGHGSKLKSS